MAKLNSKGHSISISRINEELGLTQRTVQHWCDMGVLFPKVGTQHFGRGRHREFDPDPAGELALARIASVVAQFRMPVAHLAVIVDHFRRTDEGQWAIKQALCGRIIWAMINTDGLKITAFSVATSFDKISLQIDLPASFLLNVTYCLEPCARLSSAA